jgi:hypothetical protein
MPTRGGFDDINDFDHGAGDGRRFPSTGVMSKRDAVAAPGHQGEAQAGLEDALFFARNDEVLAAGLDAQMEVSALVEKVSQRFRVARVGVAHI